jgi:3-deoxy-D-manno-octulosonate 8-phosphate phosphatase KdsC-like HAD superfamily phosphatase
MIKLIILDVDGIMTDGKKYYGQDGSVYLKSFCDKDWTSIKRFKSLGINVIFLSGDENINKLVADNRNIDFYLSRSIPKEFLLKTI